LNIIAIQALSGAYLRVGYFSAEIPQYNLYNYWFYTLILSLVGMALTTYVAEIKSTLHGLQLKDSALNAAANGIVITNIEGKIEWANQAFSQLTGFNVEEVYSHNPKELVKSGKQSPEYYQNLWETILSNQVWQGELINRRKDGTLYDEEMTITPLTDKTGAITHFVAVKQDITQRKKIELALKESHQKMFSLLNSLAEGAYGMDTNGNCTFVNQSFLQTLGYENADEIVGKHIHELIHHSHPDGTHYPAEECKIYTSYINNQEVHVSDEVFWRKDGVAIPVEYWSRPILIDGVVTGAIATFIDITKRKRAEHELRIAASVFESHEGMFVTDANKIILRVNHAFTNITGYTAAEAVGQTPDILNSNQHNSLFYDEIWKSVKYNGSWENDVWSNRKNAEAYQQHLTITAIKDQNGTITNYIAIFNDITESQAAIAEIERLAFYDPLTSLPNRRLLRERLKQALTACHRTGKNGAVLFIDMDNFKNLNDSLGHDMGDLLLKQVAQRLTACVRRHDTVARLGGDEFVVMLEELSTQSAEAAAQTETIGNKILTSLNQPYQLVKHLYHSTPSIGATFFNGLEKEIDELLKQADIAMYQAKTSGRNTLRFFDPQMQVNINARVALEADLRVAIAQEQFELYCQPQIQQDQKMCGVEVFIRWHHPERGLLLPAEFMKLAEETGLILQIEQWVLETACAQIKMWAKNANTAQLQLAVNISPRQFRKAHFVEQLSEILNRNAINPAHLTLELTENLLNNNVSENIHIMETLRKMGVRFSIDDFGTGFSSLACLTQLPLDQLKIDNLFIKNLGIKSSDTVIVQTIIGMGNNLGLEVIAKGVETIQQQALLDEYGCSCCQGYLFGMPIPLAQFAPQ
jgi:diguanylate cyclase (GGDEF)-like protein/PAS domain S-box-containing protein